jgi:hypothetical protein
MGNFNPNYFEKKAGSLEEAILNAVNGVKTQIEDYDLDEKLSDAEFMARKQKQADDRKRAKIAKGKMATSADANRAQRADANRAFVANKQKKLDDIKRKKDALKKERERAMQSNSFDPSDFNLEILVLENIISEMQLELYLNEKKMDAVGQEDGDIDNDGDKDSSDKYLAKRRKAIGKAMKSEATPGSMDYQRYIQGLKQQLRDVMRNDGSPAEADELEDRIEKAIKRDREASRVTSKRESYGMNEAVGKDIAKKMMGSKAMKSFASKVAKMKSVTQSDLEKMLPDYVAGADISKLFEAQDGGDFKTHMMYDPKTGKGYEAKTMDDHLRMKKMGYSHEKPKMEAYELGTDEYTNHTKKMTPGQFESQGKEAWNEISSNIQKKQTSMREALAKVWGMDEGKSPFESFATGDQKMKEKKQKNGKTMTGKPMTKVDVEPDMKEKKN